MRIAIVGGGTGGHVYPGIAVAQAWRDRAEIVFLGQKNKLEGQAVPQADFKLIPIAASPISRKISLDLFKTGWNLLRGTLQSFRFLRKFKPDLILGTGGYVAAPALLGALLLKIPIILHEQNAYPSLTNRLLSRAAKVVCISLSPAEKHFPRAKKIILTGNPVRSDILDYDRKKARLELGLEEQDQMVLIAGGSQGARSVNRAVVRWLKNNEIKKNWKIVHATGKDNYSDVLAYYKKLGVKPEEKSYLQMLPYIDKMGQFLAAADLFVGRSGATTVSEIIARGIPAILIPYPFAAEDHQTANARFLEKNGAAIILPDEELEAGKLASLVEELLNDRKRLEKMGRESTILCQENSVEQISKVMETVLQKPNVGNKGGENLGK